ncbi:MAG TPA: sigma 54-interacting transcriptional regulator [Verrucomicrobiae bacterium]|nr:sigma 54-interacting transcriptional regulator [Verrucomicrobiae bacterium]
MRLSPNYKPEFESLAKLLLEVARERSTDQLFHTIVQRMAERPHVAVAALWLLDKGDLCSSCPRQAQCPDRNRCLHLVASASYASKTTDPRAEDPTIKYGRVPVGFGEIGRVATSGQAFVSHDSTEDASGIGEAEWAAKAEILGLDAQPIIFNLEILGVVALFSRIPTPAQGPTWVRIFADHIATAIINTRAFEENERLKHQLELENSYLREEVLEAKAFGDIVGQSQALKGLLRQVEKVARTDATVLILGESGTGKELVAREIHKQSRRNQRPLIRVNCASIPKELYESEFFGHVRGAFTGALRDRAGRFEAADGGTLFLDEVGEIPPELQGKFLRVLQEKQYERVGEEKTRTVDVRIIAATNRDLKTEVELGRFRQDLYYRLNVFPIEVAPLRKRKDDIPLLAAHFLDQAARRLNLPRGRLTHAHLVQLQTYDWPGNVRELQNTIERALILAQNGVLDFDSKTEEKSSAPPLPAVSSQSNGCILTDIEIQQREQQNMLAALEKARWKIHGPGGAAEVLGIKPTTLISRAKKFGLKKPTPKP